MKIIIFSVMLLFNIVLSVVPGKVNILSVMTNQQNEIDVVSNVADLVKSLISLDKIIELRDLHDEQTNYKKSRQSLIDEEIYSRVFGRGVKQGKMTLYGKGEIKPCFVPVPPHSIEKRTLPPHPCYIPIQGSSKRTVHGLEKRGIESCWVKTEKTFNNLINNTVDPACYTRIGYGTVWLVLDGKNDKKNGRALDFLEEEHPKTSIKLRHLTVRRSNGLKKKEKDQGKDDKKNGRSLHVSGQWQYNISDSKPLPAPKGGNDDKKTGRSLDGLDVIGYGKRYTSNVEYLAKRELTENASEPQLIFINEWGKKRMAEGAAAHELIVVHE